MATASVLNHLHQRLHALGEILAVKPGLGICYAIKGTGNGTVDLLGVVVGFEGQEIGALGSSYVDDLNILTLGNRV